MLYSRFEQQLVHYIRQQTNLGNLDNISRTKAYFQFYRRNKEIKWAFLASQVSRNAGWNMTDLKGVWFPKVIKSTLCDQLFFTYERANWLIFEDAFPQLMIYEISKRERTSFFHLLKQFNVSKFMQKEWELFFEKHDEQRLMTALIINEQNLIQKPVIEHPYYKKKVFRSLPYLFQDWFHFTSVLFPTVDGELFGFSVHDFTNVSNRIDLGKRLAWLLFHHKYYERFLQFSRQTEHTGARYDYEQYFTRSKKPKRDTPILRFVYPVIRHHRHDFKDWYKKSKPIKKWFKPVKPPTKFVITEWYTQKQKVLQAAVILEAEVLPRLSNWK